MKNIVLIGMPGCGKSVIGKILAEKLDMNFLDLDSYIEASTKLTIREIFKAGEAGFRDIEDKAVLKVSEKTDVVIATGGGVVKRYENILNLRKNSIIIYINRSTESIAADIDVESRPLLSKDPYELYRLFEERGSLHKKYCDYEVMNISNIDEVVKDIIEIYSGE